MADQSDIVHVVGKLADVAKPIADVGARLIQNLLGRPCAVAGELLGDQIYYWQWCNRLRIAHKAQQILDADGVAATVLPPGFLLPLLDAAGNVDDDSLQDLWARLLAEGVKSEAARHPAYVRVLQQLNGADAHAFRELVHSHTQWYPLRRGSGSMFASTRMRTMFGNSGQVEAQASNLIALGLIRQQPIVSVEEPRIEVAPRASISYGGLELTAFGIEFAKAVMVSDTGEGESKPE